MKILYFTYYNKSGASIHISEFNGAMQSAHPNYKSYNFGTKSNGFREEKSRFGVFYFHVFKKLLINIIYVWKELNILKKESPDVVIARTTLYGYSIILSTRVMRIPIILEVNAPLAYEYKKYYKNDPVIARIIEKTIMKYADSIIVVSNTLKSYLIQYYNIESSKIYVNPNGFNQDKFNRDYSHELYNIAVLDHKDNIVIGFVGSFQVWHNLLNTVILISEVIKSRPNIYLLLVGTGPQEGMIRKYVDNNNLSEKVLFAGMVPHDDIPRYINRMDIALLTNSNWYGSPIKLFEYMAMGKAIFAINSGAISEVIVNGKDGILVDNNEMDIKNQLNLLIENKQLRETIGCNARIKAFQSYTWLNNAGRALNVCGETCKAYGKTNKRSSLCL